MKEFVFASAFLLISLGALAESESSQVTNRLDAVLSVPRCQAILKSGAQCPAPASEGKSYCWRHRMTKAAEGANQDVKEAWTETKTWSTNAWSATKRGTEEAWSATKKGTKELWKETKDSANATRIGIVELFGGKDAEGDSNGGK